MTSKPNSQCELGETLERLRSVTRFSTFRSWLDLLGISSRQYRGLLETGGELSDHALIDLANFLDVDPTLILSGDLDFRELASRFAEPQDTFPEPYDIATFGRRRATIISLDFVEKTSGWRQRSRVLKEFGVSESLMRDLMAPISMQFITDVCQWLRRELGYGPREFYRMGTYSLMGNRNTILSETYSRCEGPSEIYELMFNEMLKFYEQNCHYSITRLDSAGCAVEVRSNPYIAEAIGVKELGGPDICDFKRGWMACAPGFIGREFAHVKERRCVHRGDPCCEFHIHYERLH